jgi:5-methylcytosine-specific restriction endonuclease McrBC regulatory subunit McrC
MPKWRMRQRALAVLFDQSRQQRFYAGRLALSCVFDEFGLDAPINRLLKRAASIVAGSTVLQAETRRRAARLRRYLAVRGESQC